MENTNVFITIKLAIAAICGGFGAAFGWLGWLIVAWIACMTLDYATGTMAACANGEWSSKRAREGIWHKAGMLMVVLAAALLDAVLGGIIVEAGISTPVPYDTLLLPITMVWYTITEIGSVVENAAAMGAPVPAPVAKMLAKAREMAN